MSSSAAESRRRPLLGAAVAVVVLGLLVAVGRWEGRHHARVEATGMARTLALIGPLDSPSLSGYRVLPGFDCLVYRRGVNPYALEACADAQGRIVETIDRRSFHRVVDSLREDPAASTVHVDRALVDRLLRRMGARAAR